MRLTVAEALTRDENLNRDERPKSVVFVWILQALITVVFTKIFEQCIQTRRLNARQIRNPGFFRRGQLKEIIRDACKDTRVTRVAIENGIDPETIHDVLRDKAYRRCLRVAASITEGDLA